MQKKLHCWEPWSTSLNCSSYTSVPSTSMPNIGITNDFTSNDDFNLPWFFQRKQSTETKVLHFWLHSSPIIQIKLTNKVSMVAVYNIEWLRSPEVKYKLTMRKRRQCNLTVGVEGDSSLVFEQFEKECATQLYKSRNQNMQDSSLCALAVPMAAWQNFYARLNTV